MNETWFSNQTEKIDERFGNWAIGLCEPGEINDCCYSYWCTGCAAAQARSLLDGSDCAYNYFCMNLLAERWLVRTAYGIQGTAEEDCFESCLCPCCVANQMLQTARQLQDPFGPDPATHLVRDDTWIGGYKRDCLGCMYAFCCTTCAVGSAMEEAMGMPFWMGCCCMYPCAARNAMRYHYRIRNDEGECCEDGCVPFAVVTFTHCLPPISQWLVAVYWTIFVMQMLAESKARARPNQPSRYIAGYTKPQLVGFDPSMGVIQLQPKF